MLVLGSPWVFGDPSASVGVWVLPDVEVFMLNALTKRPLRNPGKRRVLLAVAARAEGMLQRQIGCALQPLGSSARRKSWPG